MYFFSHIYISKALYKYFSKEIKLEKKAFYFGNIKPDLFPACLANHHTLKNYLFIVNEQANRLVYNNLSAKEFSVDLGVICHFICDFFCYYHLNENLYNKKLLHLFYEIRLHVNLHVKHFRSNFIILPKRSTVKKTIPSIILECLKDYQSNPPKMNKDIDFAFSTAIWACSSILDMRHFAPRQTEKSKINIPSFPSVKASI